MFIVIITQLLIKEIYEDRSENSHHFCSVREVVGVTAHGPTVTCSVVQ